MTGNTTDIEKRLWDAADELRANSKHKSSDYSVPVLGLTLSASYRQYTNALSVKASGPKERDAT